MPYVAPDLPVGARPLDVGELGDQAAPRDPYWNGAFSAYWESTDKRVGVALFAKELFTPHESAFYGLAGNLRF